MKSGSETLEQRTQRYWRVSRAYNGQSDEKMSFGVASKHLNRIILFSNPAHSLVQQALMLQDELVTGQSRSMPVNQQQK